MSIARYTAISETTAPCAYRDARYEVLSYCVQNMVASTYKITPLYEPEVTRTCGIGLRRRSGVWRRHRADPTVFNS